MIKTTVQSTTIEGKNYEVFLTEKGWHCNCPAFLFDQKRKGFCKHVVEAQRKLEGRLQHETK